MNQCPLTLFDLDCNGNCKSLSLSDVMKLPLFNQMDQNMMIESCVLAGCDYLPPIPRMGIRTAIKRLLIHKTGLAVISELRAENDWEIPDNYEQDFQNACSIFTQHRVLDHHSKSVVGIYEECILDIAGPYISNEDAINIAIGRMNPKTKYFFDTENNYKLQKSVDISNVNGEIEGGFKKCNDSNVPDSFFTFANLKDLKYNDSTKFISFLKEKAISEGFQIVLRLKKTGEYIILKCHMHSNKNSPCNFRINLQSHNFNKSKQYYQITKSTYLKYNHELSALKCAHLSIDNETKKIIKNMSKVNIDSTKISKFLYQQKALRITTKQVSY